MCQCALHAMLCHAMLRPRVPPHIPTSPPLHLPSPSSQPAISQADVKCKHLPCVCSSATDISRVSNAISGSSSVSAIGSLSLSRLLGTALLWRRLRSPGLHLMRDRFQSPCAELSSRCDWPAFAFAFAARSRRDCRFAALVKALGEGGGTDTVHGFVSLSRGGGLGFGERPGTS